MPGITAEQAQAKLDAWLDAEAALATAQEYTITTSQGARTLTRADLKEVREAVKYWDRKVKDLTPGAHRRRSFAAFLGE